MKKGSYESDINYELEYLRSENEKLKNQLGLKGDLKLKKSMENDIKNLLKISMKMKDLLEDCRSQTLPFELGRRIDTIIKEIENYD